MELEPINKYMHNDILFCYIIKSMHLFRIWRYKETTIWFWGGGGGAGTFGWDRLFIFVTGSAGKFISG